MKTLLLIGLLTFFTQSHSTHKKVFFNPGISCTLSADKKIYKIGELPKFKVGITNNTKNEIYLVGSLDGSDVKWRYPHCYFEINKPTELFARCGNMNTLAIEDFKLVKVAETFDPYEGFFDDYKITDLKNFNKEGIYKIKFHYSTNSAKLADFIGDRFNSINSDSAHILSLLAKVPKVEIQSNEVEIIFQK